MTLEAGVLGFPETADGARRLAGTLGLSCQLIEVHRFPDGESLVRVPDGSENVIVYRSLDRPNDKLVELALVVSVLRRQGVRHLTLVAPYLAYMRQDAVFRPGEPVSQTVVGGWLASLFDRFVCVEPHLHRVATLDGVFGGRPSFAVSGVAPIAQHLRAASVDAGTVIVGPDEESAPLAEGIAGLLGLQSLVGRKVRHGDLAVTIDLPKTTDLADRPVVIVDDVISSGATIVTCAEAVRRRGGRIARVCGVHALHSAETAAWFARQDLAVVSCDGVTHPSNAIALADSLAPFCR